MDFIILYSVKWVCIILTHFSDLLHDMSRLSKLCLKLCCSSFKKKYVESQNLSTLAMTSCDIPASTSFEIIIIYKKTDSWKLTDFLSAILYILDKIYSDQIPIIHVAQTSMEIKRNELGSLQSSILNHNCNSFELKKACVSVGTIW